MQRESRNLYFTFLEWDKVEFHLNTRTTETLPSPENPEREPDFCHIDFQFSCINILLEEFTEVCI